MAIEAVNTSTLADVLDLPDGTTVTISGPLAATGLSYSSLANFAGGLFDPFLVLSSGIAAQITGANTSGSQGTDFGAVGASGDSVTITFVIPKPVTARAFSFDFTFLSEEYPEFVGSQYNDFLSVKVNGVEAARDTSGKPITINNNFFTSQYSPIGTFFDGQTPPLTVTVPVAASANTVTVSIEVADVGDGRYDSAAFLSGFKFVEPQVVWLQFDQGSFGYDSIFNAGGFSLPGSGLTVAQQDAIVAAENALYSDFLIEFTRTKPTSGDYSTVHVGGKVSDLPTSLGAQASLLGQAEKIDYGNADKSDSAFVLSGQMVTSGGTVDMGLLEQVIAHETGHILGLRHVLSSTQLMSPYAAAANTTIGGASPLAEIDDATKTVKALPGGITQDSHAELEKSLGLANASKLLVAESLYDKLLKLFSFDLNASSSSTLYDVKVVIANTENEVQTIKEVGTVSAASLVDLLLPATDGDKVVLLAKSSADGPYNVFTSAGTPGKLPAGGLTEAAMLNTFGVSVADVDVGTLNLVKVAANGTVTKIGTVSAFETDAGNGPATDGADVLTGTASAADTIIGLGGDDTISGLGGNDRLFGNDGNDLLNGGAGDDEMTGGEGSDAFLFGTGSSGTDRITDFGMDDFLVTTVRIVDSNDDGIITFGGNKALNLTGGVVGITNEQGAAVRSLEYDGAHVEGGVSYYVYSLVGSTADPALALVHL